MANFENMDKIFNTKFEETTFLKGDPGQDGISPEVSVSDIPGGHRITIVDVNGENTFDVMDGVGEDVKEEIDALSAKDVELQEQITNVEELVNEAISDVGGLIDGGAGVDDPIVMLSGEVGELKEQVDTINETLDGYATETYVDEAIANVEIPEVEIPTELPNPNALTINGTVYDGSEVVEITVPTEDDIHTLIDERLANFINVSEVGA